MDSMIKTDERTCLARCGNGFSHSWTVDGVDSHFRCLYDTREVACVQHRVVRTNVYIFDVFW